MESSETTSWTVIKSVFKDLFKPATPCVGTLHQVIHVCESSQNAPPALTPHPSKYMHDTLHINLDSYSYHHLQHYPPQCICNCRGTQAHVHTMWCGVGNVQEHITRSSGISVTHW